MSRVFGQKQFKYRKWFPGWEGAILWGRLSHKQDNCPIRTHGCGSYVGLALDLLRWAWFWIERLSRRLNSAI